MKKKFQFKPIIIAIFALFLISAMFYYLILKEDKQENMLIYNDYIFYETKMGETPFYTLSFGVGNEPDPENPKPYLYTFRYFPEDLEEIYVEDEVVEKVLYSSPRIYKKEIYISVDPSFTDREALSAFSLFQILSNTEQGVFKIPTQMAFSSQPQEEETGIPVKLCEDATNEIGVIILEKGENEKIYKEEGCIILQGKDLEGLRKVSEKLTYMVLRVMK